MSAASLSDAVMNDCTCVSWLPQPTRITLSKTTKVKVNAFIFISPDSIIELVKIRLTNCRSAFIHTCENCGGFSQPPEKFFFSETARRVRRQPD
jgi:hypothetical protein